jgi:hypothetical protein
MLLSAVACGTRDDPNAWSQRDSAGVTIVENSAPREDGWTLEETPELDIAAGGGSGPVDPVSVFADTRGRVIVADRGVPPGGALIGYDGEGAPVFRAGGEGAAALTRLWWASRYRADSLVAFDIAAKKLLVFGPDGSFARELDVPAYRRERAAYALPSYTAGAVGPMADGSFLTYPAGAPDWDAVPGPAWYRHDLLRVSPEGARWDTLGVFEIFQTWLGEAWSEPYPYGAVAFQAPYQDGFVFTTGDTFELRVYDAAGALRRTVRRAHAPETVNAADLEQYASWYLGRARASGTLDAATEAQLAQQLAEAQHPERRPAISNLIVDDGGNIWVEEFRWVDAAEVAPTPAPSTWSVFGPDGRWLAQVRVPAGFLVSSVSSDRVYGVQADPADAKSVRVYRLHR